MRIYILLFPLIITSIIATAQTTVLSVGKGNTMILSGSVYVLHKGDIQNNGLINSDSTATLVLNGNDMLQNIGGSSYDSTRIGNIIQNDSAIVLNTYMRVVKRDSFINGYVELNNSNWRFEKNAYYAGTDGNSKFFQTNGLGYLYKDLIGTKPFLFPIGTFPNAASYSPVTLKDDSIPDNFGVRVADNQYASYDSLGLGLAPPDNASRLPKNWVVKEDMPGESMDSIAMQWYAGATQTGFIPDSAVLDIYNINTHSFDFEYTVYVTGNDPYVLSVPRISGVDFTNTPLSYMNTSVALPVQLYTFNAVRLNNNGYLTWTTLSEDDDNYFEIERSTDGYTFTDIGHVKASGHSVRELDYSYTDKNITVLDVNTIYYRLRIVSYNGTYTYSQIRALKLSNNNIDAITMYPNPTAGIMHVDITTTQNKKIQLSIIDMVGRVLYIQPGDIISGENNIMLNIAALPEGMYVLRVESDAVQTTYPIIKTNQ